VTEERLKESELPPDSVPAAEPAKSALREYFESAVVTVIMALFGMTFIVQAVKVPTGSMQNNILIGDHLLVNKFVFAGRPGGILGRLLPYREVRRGDVIVFKYPQNPEVNYVKRVIGLPGDTVWVRNARVWVNGQELPEHRLFARSPGIEATDSALTLVKEEPPPPGATYRVYWDAYRLERGDLTPGGHESGSYAVNQPFTVAPHSYFVMGDNRDDSEDSRFWGTVPRENVVGRALIVYWSYDERTAAFSGHLLGKIFGHIRWRRTGTLIR
jgi:signal peptidase I